MKPDNRIETLFAQACHRHGYFARKIAKGSNQTADFEVTAASEMFIAEVKSINPSPADFQKLVEMKETRETSISLELGRRAKNAINKALDQLRRYEARRIPLVAVLYDNVRLDDQRLGYPELHVQPSHIDAAMFGRVRVEFDFTVGPARTSQHRSNEGVIGPKTNTLFSGVIVISDWDDQTLKIYHNPFASNPLGFATFTDTKCFHMVKSDMPFGRLGDWKQLPVARALPGLPCKTDKPSS